MDRRRRKLLYLAILLVPAVIAFGVLLFHREQTKVDKSKFEWLASNSAPKGCQMRLLMGNFYYRGGGSLYIPPAFLHAGWGTPESIHVVGADTKPLPDRLSILFYSYLEDKFYRGDFPLPYERIAQLFAEGYKSFDYRTAPHITFDRVIAGVAPGGAVAVWLDGIGREQEVFFGYAQEFDGDWHRLMGMPAHVKRLESREESLKQATATDPLVERYLVNSPLGVWETYRVPYRWRPVFPDVPTPIVSIVYQYFNGEKFELPTSGDADMQKTARPVPSHIDFAAKIPGDNVKTWFQYDFDESEILGAFKTLGADAAPLDLIFRRSFVQNRARYDVVLRSGGAEIALTKTRLELNLAP